MQTKRSKEEDRGVLEPVWGDASKVSRSRNGGDFSLPLMKFFSKRFSGNRNSENTDIFLVGKVTESKAVHACGCQVNAPM